MSLQFRARETGGDQPLHRRRSDREGGDEVHPAGETNSDRPLRLTSAQHSPSGPRAVVLPVSPSDQPSIPRGRPWLRHDSRPTGPVWMTGGVVIPCSAEQGTPPHRSRVEADLDLPHSSRRQCPSIPASQRPWGALPRPHIIRGGHCRNHCSIDTRLRDDIRPPFPAPTTRSAGPEVPRRAPTSIRPRSASQGLQRAWKAVSWLIVDAGQLAETILDPAAREGEYESRTASRIT
jgi:hypothetical protein